MQLLNVEVIEAGKGQHLPSCQSCGHPIKQLFTVKTDKGGVMVVGIDCAEMMLGKVQLKEQQITKRFNAATREWQKKTPKPLEGETKSQYINRRIAEKGNAYTAWQGYQRIVHQHNSQGLLHLAAESILKGRGVFYPNTSHRCDKNAEYGKCQACQVLKEQVESWYTARNAAQDEIAEITEKQYQAHRFDFIGKAAYQVKGI